MTAIGVSQTIGMAPDIDKVKNSAASIFEILDSKPKIDSSNDEGLKIDTLKGDVELRNVSFKYPTRPNIPIFVDLCLSIPSGKVKLLATSNPHTFKTCIYLSYAYFFPIHIKVNNF